MSITVIGDAFIDIIVPVGDSKPGETKHWPLNRTLGGTANVAVAVARHGEEVTFVGKVGNDVFGQYFKDNIEKMGVKNRVFVDNSNSTGLCISLVLADGERILVADRGANDNLTVNDLNSCQGIIEDSKIIYLSGYSLISKITADSIIATLNSCHGKNEIWFNPGAPNIIKGFYRDFIAKYVNVLVLNLDEAKAMTGALELVDIIKDLSTMVDLGAITLGKDGCITFSKDSSILQTDEYVNKVSDTTGAGDNFAAGFIVGRQKGLNMCECAKLGNQVASNYLKEKAAFWK